ncbi:MAG TPA: hypothetical protein VKB80_18555 [Kofleriaceae bacterium]|nr:hypothetical protein [Kofleriaceae bacterium]
MLRRHLALSALRAVATSSIAVSIACTGHTGAAPSASAGASGAGAASGSGAASSGSGAASSGSGAASSESGTAAAAAPPASIRAAAAAAQKALLAKYGEGQRARIERGVAQVASFWRESDGDMAAFCEEQFAGEPAAVDALFARLEAQFEQIGGHMLELGRSLRWATEVESGPILPVDSLLAAYEPSAHLTEDLFASKVAFAALLNFPLTRLADRLRDGPSYSRRTWAEVRLTGAIARRIPGDIVQRFAAAAASGEEYIAGYNIWMHHVLGEDGKRLFPSGKRLISHWNLRDELKANYADADGQAKQKTIVAIMERIVSQTIPKAVIDNPRLDWNPFSNAVTAAPADTIEKDAPARAAAPSGEREPDARFEHVLALFRAARQADRFAPLAPTYLARAFEDAEVPEERVRALLVAVLESPLADKVAAEASRRLGRPLAAQDIWYEFGGGAVPEAELDKATRARYRSADAFAADLPRIFRALGFTAAKARFLAARITVDPSRGAGHAMGAQRRTDKAHLRTRVEAGGMDYKGYNIAVHELGHNVEQTFSLYSVDHTLLAGVPNTAFTEALAFLFQDRDLALLGRPARGGEVEKLRVLDAFWNTREIAGSALVELDVWRWLYDHPDATAAQLRETTVQISRDTWNRYYARLLGGKDRVLLGIYSHTISAPLYLFNYVLGHAIAFQVEGHLHGKDKATFAREFERMATFGRVTPDLWMINATGAPVGPEPLLEATARALGGTP